MWRVAIPLVLIGLMVAFLGCSMRNYEPGSADMSAKRSMAPMAAMASPGGKADTPQAEGGYRKDIQSGTLTAGSFDELEESAEALVYWDLDAEMSRLCLEFQSKLDATAEREVFAEVPWVPGELKEVVSLVVGC